MNNPYFLIEQIFDGMYLDKQSLFYYDFKLIDLLSKRIRMNHIHTLFDEELDYDSVIMLEYDDINNLKLPIGPKLAIRNIIKNEHIKEKERKYKYYNELSYKYLEEFDIYDELQVYKYIFVENKIDYNKFIQ